MRNHKSILYLLAPALFLGASCAQTATNTSTVSNTNDNANVEVVTNTNTTVSNENTDTFEVNNEANNPDLLTYTNKKYGFSFSYPSIAEIQKADTNGCVVSNANKPDVTVGLSEINYQTTIQIKPVEAIITDQTEVKINNFTVTKQIGKGANLGDELNPEHDFTIYFMPYQDYTLKFLINSSEINDQQYLEDIIATLK